MQNPVWRRGAVSVFLGEKSGKYPDGNQVVVRGADTLVAFDTPLSSNRLGPEFTDADLVILGHVHEDHMAGLHRVPKAKVVVHEADVEAARSWEGLSRHYGYGDEVLRPFKGKIEEEFFYAPRPDAEPYRDGAQWDLGGGVTVRAIHMPGHTAGHCVLLVEPEGVAFIGDIELGSFGPYYGDLSSSLADFRRSIARLPEVPARVWVTSHHRGVYTERAAFLAALAAFGAKIDERSERLLALLAGAPKTLDELVGVGLIYPTDFDEPGVSAMERHVLAQHLDELVAAGYAEQVDEAGRFASA